VIIDEAQNLTPHEVKTIVSRAGEGTKMILTGDPEQIDNPYLDASSNGLSYKWSGSRGRRPAAYHPDPFRAQPSGLAGGRISVIDLPSTAGKERHMRQYMIDEISFLERDNLDSYLKRTLKQAAWRGSIFLSVPPDLLGPEQLGHDDCGPLLLQRDPGAERHPV
jgi:hypothetical protein